jgi:integrase
MWLNDEHRNRIKRYEPYKKQMAVTTFVTMASLIRQPTSKYWTAAFRDSEGKQQRRSTKETNKKRAQAVADQLERAAQSKGSLARLRRTFAEFCREHFGSEASTMSVAEYTQQWLRRREAETSPATHRRYRNAIDKWLEFLGPNASQGVEGITQAQVFAFRDACAKKSAALTANTELKIIKMLFRSARREGYLFEDPAEGVKTVKNREAFARRPFSIDELRAVLAMADEEWQILIKFGLYTGQRLGDLALLTWSQIDLERDEIRMTTRKTGKQLLIPIAAPLREHLRTLSAGDNPRAPVHPRAYATVNAQFERVGTLSNQFSDLLVACGLRGPQPHRSRGIGRKGKRKGAELSFHSLRHTAVSLLKDAGVPDAVVMALVAHESTAMSHRYTHVGTEALTKAAKTLPEI